MRHRRCPVNDELPAMSATDVPKRSSTRDMRWIAAVAVCLVMAASARAEDWGARRDPFDPVVVRRYKAILARDPHDDGALRHLVELYQRYRTIAKLEAEYRTQLAEGDDWATL